MSFMYAILNLCWNFCIKIETRLKKNENGQKLLGEINTLAVKVKKIVEKHVVSF